MRIRKRHARIFAIILAFLMVLTSFSGTGAALAAEGEAEKNSRQTTQKQIAGKNKGSDEENSGSAKQGSASDTENGKTDKATTEEKGKTEKKEQTQVKDKTEEKDKTEDKDKTGEKDKTEEKEKTEDKDKTGKKDKTEDKGKTEDRDKTGEKDKTEDKGKTEDKKQTGQTEASKKSAEEKTEATAGKTEETTEDTKKEDSKEDQSEDNKWNKSAITGNSSKDGVTVYVTAPAGSFPEGTSVKISPLSDSEEESIAKSIKNGKEAVGFDITFLAKGKKVQPGDGYLVDVRFVIGGNSSLAGESGENAVLHAYHVSESGKTESLGNTQAPEKGGKRTLSVGADSFSPYVLVKEAAEAVKAETKAQATSANLADFLTKVVCSAPTDENGSYIINTNEPYDLTLTFSENENLQFDDESELVYDLPDGMKVNNIGSTAFAIDIVDNNGSATITNNIYRVSDGKLIVRFNQSDPNIDRLKAVADVDFEIAISASFDGSEGSIVFNSDIEKDFVYKDTSELAITKAVTYNSATDTASYVLRVTSTGINENVSIQDMLTGTALTFNKDVTVESSVSGVLSVTPDYGAIANGFALNIPEMNNKEVLTIRYSASVDNSKITGTGTVDQTNNKARVTSDQDPEGKEAEANFAGKINFHKISKSRVGDPVSIGDNKYEVTWRVLVNRDHKLNIGGTTIYDSVVQRSRPFMQFTGDGITVNVTMEDGSTETRNLPFSQLEQINDDNGLVGWGYAAPQSDGKAAYEIICKTVVDMSKAAGDLTVVNSAQIEGFSTEASASIGYIGEDKLKITKDCIGTTAQETEWRLTVHASGKGYPNLYVVDDAPKLTYNGVDYLDSLQEDSVKVEGLLEGETYRMTVGSSGRTFVLRFYQDEGRTQEGLKATADGNSRDIVITFKTTVNQDWLNLAAENGYSNYAEHRNAASVRVNDWSDYDSAIAIPRKATFKKEFVETGSVTIDGVDYPVYRYVLTLGNPGEDLATITDAFDTDYLKYYQAEGIKIYGGTSSEQNDSDGEISAADTNDGIAISVNRFPKDSSGEFYSVYKIYYSLVVKDKTALDALNKAALEQNGYTLKNVARWNELSSDEVQVVHTYYPYVDKELVDKASEDNDYVAEFKLVINKYADDLDPASDTLNIQDELSSNLRFIQDSLTITPADDSIKVQFDSESNTLMFSDVPDNTRFEITYRARVLGKGNVTYSNTVKFGNYEKTVEENIKIESSGSGSGSNPSITLIKRDADELTNTLSGATFQLYYMNGDTRVPVQDKDGNDVEFTTGQNGSVLIAGNQNTLGWTLWQGRTYCLVETAAPAGYELNTEPTLFVLSANPSSQIEYDIVGDSLSVQDNRVKTEVSVRKNWVGPGLESVTVKLLADKQQVDSVQLSEENNWTHTFTNLDKYHNGTEISYEVEEEPSDNGNYDSKTSGTASDGYVITNTNAETIDIPVTKTWVGKALDEVKIWLLADEKEAEEVTLTAEGGWTYTFSGLAKYDSTDGHEIEYSVKEENIPDYTSGISGTAADGFTIINTITGKVSVPVTKAWVGAGAEKVTVNLLADGNQVDAVELSEANHWQHTFTDLEKYNNGEEIKYTVEEEAIENYDSRISGNASDGYVITNTNNEKTEIPVSKVWVGEELDEVTVNLLVDGEEVDEATLTEEEDWEHTFTDLAKYDSTDGHEIKYTITEDDIEGYTSKIEGSPEEGFVVTNTEDKGDTTTESTESSSKKDGTSGTSSKSTAKTGDENNVSAYVILLLTAGVALLLFLNGKKRKEDGQE